jgi:hypothetical protein
MSKKRIMDDWECGMCFESIDNRPHVRIAVDVAMEEDIGGVSSLMDDEVMVLAVFHAACISETRDDEELEEDVPYLDEARQLMDQLASQQVKGPKKSPKARKRGHLWVINGGNR